MGTTGKSGQNTLSALRPTAMNESKKQNLHQKKNQDKMSKKQKQNLRKRMHGERPKARKLVETTRGK
jgi:hypothetical protein